MGKKTTLSIVMVILAPALIICVGLGCQGIQGKAVVTENPSATTQEPNSQLASQLTAKSSLDVTDKENRELEATVFNKDKDVWGWSSGKYIVLHWNQYAFSFFNIYRKTDKNPKWNLANSKPLGKPEFFDSDIAEYNKIIYRIEAVNQKGDSSKLYSPVVFSN